MNELTQVSAFGQAVMAHGKTALRTGKFFELHVLNG